MKAIQVAEYGQVERLELIELEELVPNDDQVLIDVAGSGINPVSYTHLTLTTTPYV